jgi:hypothetical protein
VFKLTRRSEHAIKRYVIDSVHGKANADGGLSLYERYKKGIDPPDCDMAEWGDGQTVHPQDMHIPKHFKTYSTLNHDTWSRVPPHPATLHWCSL